MPFKHIVFDVVGTLVSFDAYISQITSTIGPKLLSHNITPKTFAYTWMTASELEFTFLSISSRHTPYKQILIAVFYRTLWFCGINSPRSLFSDAERDLCVAGYSNLQLRPGAVECFRVLREAGFTIWLLTTADIPRVQGYFSKANVSMPAENFISCDTAGVAKPALAAYKPVLEKFEEGDEKWFAASHMWDVSAAVKVGFKGAYCEEYEMDGCGEIFEEEMQVIAKGLKEMAEGIVKAVS